MQLVRYFSLSKQIKDKFEHFSQPIFCLLAEFWCPCDKQIGTQSSSTETWWQQIGCLTLGQLPLPAPGLPLTSPHLCMLKVDMIILWTNSRDVKELAYLNPELSNSKSCIIYTKLSCYFRRMKCPIMRIKAWIFIKILLYDH